MIYYGEMVLESYHISIIKTLVILANIFKQSTKSCAAGIFLVSFLFLSILPSFPCSFPSSSLPFFMFHSAETIGLHLLKKIFFIKFLSRLLWLGTSKISWGSPVKNAICS
eukprot:TRINITY_DN1896_c1_g1_i1.p1 TRINITY_DN1896_c1_g1~~TRINITY_DN1896_c1_g1_i1.p1  ORF type:complete len:110 (-),score=4.26 TRINITY_DN1896_c1_g1_i1:550-879(-)